MQKCKQCEWEFPDDIRICPYCGHPVEPEDQKQKRRFKLRRHPGTLPEGAKGRPSGLVSSTARILTIALISAIVLASLIVGLVLIPFLGGHPQTPPPILILRGNIIPGGNISVQGHNFSPGGTVTFTIYGHTATIASGSSSAQHLPGTVSLALMSLLLLQLAPHMTKAPSGGTSVPVKSDGTFEATIQVDPHWPVGSSHLLVATDQSSAQQAHVTVIVPHQAELVSCSHSTAITNIALGPVLAGQKQPVSTVFTLCTTGSGVVHWTASTSHGSSWLGIKPASNTLSSGAMQDVTVSASIADLLADQYNDTITFTISTSNGMSQAMVTVSLGVQPPSPAQLCKVNGPDLGELQQGQSKSGVITFGNCGGEPLQWSASFTEGWDGVTLKNSSGIVAPGDTGQIFVTARAGSGDLGKLSAVFSINSNGGTQQATVSVTVVPPPPPPCLQITAVDGKDSPDSSNVKLSMYPGTSSKVTVTNCGHDNGTLSAAVSTSDKGTWLNTDLKPDTPLAGGGNQAITITISASAPYDHTGTVKVVLATSGGETAVTINISVRIPVK